MRAPAARSPASCSLAAAALGGRRATLDGGGDDHAARLPGRGARRRARARARAGAARRLAPRLRAAPERPRGRGGRAACSCRPAPASTTGWRASRVAEGPEPLVLLDALGGTAPDPHFWLDPIGVRDAALPALEAGARRGRPGGPRALRGAPPRLRAHAHRARRGDPRARSRACGAGRWCRCTRPGARFAARYGIPLLEPVQHRGAEEPTPRSLAGLADAARSGGAVAVLVEPQLPAAAAEALAEALGVPAVVADPLGDPRVPERASYAALLRFDAAAFRRAPLTGAHAMTRAHAAPVVHIEGVSVARDGRVVLEDIRFDVAAGAFVGVCGPNGAGKTTLLRAILGLVPLSAGRIEVLGRPAAERASIGNGIGYVPQRHAFPADFPAHALDVVRLGRLHQREGRARERSKAEEALARVGIAELAARPGRPALGRRAAPRHARAGALRQLEAPDPRRAHRRPRPPGRAGVLRAGAPPPGRARPQRDRRLARSASRSPARRTTWSASTGACTCTASPRT